MKARFGWTLASAMLAGSFGSAHAADMAVKAPPIAAPVWNWTGFYVGFNVGGAWTGNNDVNSVGTPIFANPLVPGTTAFVLANSVTGVTTNIPLGRGSGFIGGAQAGYDWQFKSGVVGIEADIQGLSARQSSALVLTTVPLTLAPGNSVNSSLSATNNVDWLGTVRGRLGLLAKPSLLLYATGGLAYGDVRSSTTINQALVGPSTATVNAPYGSVASNSQTRAGWAAGVGGEWKFAPKWSAKIEYLHYDLGTVSYGGTLSNVVVPPGGVVPTGGVFYTLGATSSTRFSGDIVRVGVNYSFTGPVVAKY